MNAVLEVLSHFFEEVWLWVRGKEFYDSCQKLAGKPENAKTHRIRPAVLLGFILMLIALFALIGGAGWLLFRSK